MGERKCYRDVVRMNISKPIYDFNDDGTKDKVKSEWHDRKKVTKSEEGKHGAYCEDKKQFSLKRYEKMELGSLR